jgi:hypothetical protein
MAHDYYLDSINGDDSSGAGTATSPWKTVARLYAPTPPLTPILPVPIVETTTIHLCGTPDPNPAQPYDYLTLTLSGVQCLNGAQLIWQPYIPPTTGVGFEWFDSYYWQGRYPVASTAVPPPPPPPPLNVLTSVRPCKFSQGVFIDGGSNNIVFKGLEIDGGAMPVLQMAAAAGVGGGSSAQFLFCEFNGSQTPTSVGVAVLDGSAVTVENSFAAGFNTGALVANGSSLTLNGNNSIIDSGAVGLLAWADGRVMIQTWMVNSGQLPWATTTIQTSSPRNAYKAVWASASKILIPDLSIAGMQYRGLLQIIKQDLHGNDEYYGVALEAQSLLLGAKLVMFTNPVALGTTQPAFETVPAAQQISLAAGEGCIVAK